MAAPLLKLEMPPGLFRDLQVEPEEAQSILRPQRDERYGFGFALSPYRGCGHGCRYCYVRDYPQPVPAADGQGGGPRLLHRPEDWGLMACQADSSSQDVYLNKVGTFGIGCAAYYWARLASGVGRVVSRLWLVEYAWQLLYADDLKWIAFGPHKFVVLLEAVFTWVLFGCPFSWKKTRGGMEQD